MLLRYINSNRLSVVILCVLLPIVYWIPSFSRDTVAYITPVGGMPLGAWIVSFNTELRVLASIVALLLIILNGYLLIQLNTVHIFIPYRTQLPLLFYIIFALSITQYHWLTPALVASTLIILYFYRVFSAYRNDGISINFLDAGLIISVASLIYFPAIFLFAGLIFTLLLLRPFIWREWAFGFIGLIIPYAFAFSIYYLLDIPGSELFQSMREGLQVSPVPLKLSQIVGWLYILFFVVIASYYIARAIDSMKIHARKFFLVFLAFFALAFILFFVIRGTGTGMIYVAAVPLAYLFAHYFIRCRQNWINEIFFALFIILLIWQRFK